MPGGGGRCPRHQRDGGGAGNCGGIDSPASQIRRARARWSLGWLPPAPRDSPSSLPPVARFEPLLSGEGGIRTPKPVRAPVFETGALPFCHLSECRPPGCWRKLLRHPVRAAGEGAPRGLLLSNFRGCRGVLRRRGWDGLTCFADSSSSRPLVARFEPTRLFRVAHASFLGGGGGIRTHETLSSQRLSRAPP